MFWFLPVWACGLVMVPTGSRLLAFTGLHAALAVPQNGVPSQEARCNNPLSLSSHCVKAYKSPFYSVSPRRSPFCFHFYSQTGNYTLCSCGWWQNLFILWQKQQGTRQTLWLSAGQSVFGLHLGLIEITYSSRAEKPKHLDAVLTYPFHPTVDPFWSFIPPVNLNKRIIRRSDCLC